MEETNLCLELSSSQVEPPSQTQVRDLVKIYLYRKNGGRLKGGNGILYSRLRFLQDLGYVDALMKSPDSKTNLLSYWAIAHTHNMPKFLGSHLELFQRLQNLSWPGRMFTISWSIILIISLSRGIV